MNKDVTLFYNGRISPGWEKRVKDEPIQSIPSGIATHPSGLGDLGRFLREMKEYDKIIIHHHVEPVLAFYLSKLYGQKIVWYSGSVLELAWEKEITGIDYRRISTTVHRTGSEFYGELFARLLLSDPFYGLTVRAAKAIDRATVRGFGKILANSFYLSKDLVRIYGLKNAPRVVYPGPDPLLQKLSEVPYMAKKEQDFMLTVGALIPLKNVASIIRAASHVPSSRVVVIGDGQEKNNLEDLANKLGVSVEFRGTFDDENKLANTYTESKLLVHASLHEPFGLTPLEAALFSKPSIVTNRGGPPEVVIDGVTGYTIDPMDHKGMGARMNMLLQNDSLRREMGRQARANVTKKFTLQVSIAKLLEELES